MANYNSWETFNLKDEPQLESLNQLPKRLPLNSPREMITFRDHKIFESHENWVTRLTLICCAAQNGFVLFERARFQNSFYIHLRTNMQSNKAELYAKRLFPHRLFTQCKKGAFHCEYDSIAVSAGILRMDTIHWIASERATREWAAFERVTRGWVV